MLARLQALLEFFPNSLAAFVQSETRPVSGRGHNGGS